MAGLHKFCCWARLVQSLTCPDKLRCAGDLMKSLTLLQYKEAEAALEVCTPHCLALLVWPAAVMFFLQHCLGSVLALKVP